MSVQEQWKKLQEAARLITNQSYVIRAKYEDLIQDASSDAARRALQCAAELVINYPIGSETVDIKDLEARILSLKELNWSEE